jgi:HK97 gp10 family phage protein
MARKGPGKTARVCIRSRPGEPPRRQTGTLNRSVDWEYSDDKSLARVGVTETAPYGKFLEMGTRHMEARPFLATALKQERAELVRLLTGKA